MTGVKNTSATHQQDEVKQAEKQEGKTERKKEQEQQPSFKQNVSRSRGSNKPYKISPHGRHASNAVLILKKKNNNKKERGGRRKLRIKPNQNPSQLLQPE